jgi:hypothetical protein
MACLRRLPTAPGSGLSAVAVMMSRRARERVDRSYLSGARDQGDKKAYSFIGKAEKFSLRETEPKGGLADARPAVRRMAPTCVQCPRNGPRGFLAVAGRRIPAEAGLEGPGLIWRVIRSVGTCRT